MQDRIRPRSYGQRLRTIGSQLDAGGYHSVSIVEVDGGLIVRASAPGSRTPEVLEIADGQDMRAASLAPMRGGVPHRLFPEGYKGFLSALGQRLDRSRAAAIAVVEATDFVTVGGIQPVSEAEIGITYEPLDILLLADDISRLTILEEAPVDPQPESPSTPEAAVPGPSEARIDGVMNRFTSAVEAALRSVSLTGNPARPRS